VGEWESIYMVLGFFFLADAEVVWAIDVRKWGFRLQIGQLIYGLSPH